MSPWLFNVYPPGGSEWIISVGDYVDSHTININTHNMVIF